MSLTLGPGPEFDRIRAIARALGRAAGALGDDCALVPEAAGSNLVLSTDVSVEEVHFRRDWLRPEEIGWRAAAAALSDLAAAGAEVIGLLVAVSLPRHTPTAELTEMMRGIGDAVSSVGGIVLGGDLSSGPVWSIAVTVVGRAIRPMSRRGAGVRDGVWVTGALGGARAALASWRRGENPDAEARQAFAQPLPRIEAGRWLAAHGATAMLDLSDGLGGDARHLAAASDVALRIELGSVPVCHSAIDVARSLDIEPAQFAAEGGEDYELLVTLPAEFDASGAETLRRDYGVPLTRIGAVEAGAGVQFSLDGTEIELGGFDHFR